MVLVISEEGAARLLKDVPTRDFISDAFAHCKFVSYSAEARPLLERAGLAGDLDDGCTNISDQGCETFTDKLGDLRFWSRQGGVGADGA